MATYTKIVDPNGNGADYTSIALWEAGEGSAGYVAGDIAIADCRRSGPLKDTTPVTISGWPAGVDVKIVANDNHRHNGIPGAGYVVETGVSGIPIRTYQGTLGNVLVDGIEVCNWLGAYLGISLTWGASGSVINCIVHGNSDPGSNGVSCKDDATGLIASNIIYDIAGTGILGSSGSAGKVYNNTVFNCGVGIYTYGYSVATVNNLVFSCTTCFSGNYNAGDDYNSSSDATAPGANSLINQASNPFADSDSGDFHLIEGAAPIGAGIGQALDPNVPQFDVDGDERTGTTTDIGADLYVSSGTAINCTSESITTNSNLADVQAGATVSCSSGSISTAANLTAVYQSELIGVSPGAVSAEVLNAVVLQAVDISATPGSIASSSYAVSIFQANEITASLGQVSVAKNNADVYQTSLIPCESGAVSFSALSADIAVGLSIDAGSKNIAMSAASATVFTAIEIESAAIDIGVSAFAADVQTGNFINGSLGLVGVSANNATVYVGKDISCSTGAASYISNHAAIGLGIQIDCQAKAEALSGYACLVFNDSLVGCASGSFGLSALDCSIISSTPIACGYLDVGVLALSASILTTAYIPASRTSVVEAVDRVDAVEYNDRIS